MREKWNKKSEPRISDGQPIPKRLILGESTSRPKLIHHSPSLRAIKNYNDMPIEGTFQNNIDIPMVTPENTYNSHLKYEDADGYSTSLESEAKPVDINMYDYATIGTLSLKSGSELNSDINEMGSTVKLIPTKLKMSCQIWFSRISTAICTISMAAGMGNLYRLPQTTLIRGQSQRVVPFLIVYIVLAILIGLPLLFLELGIGQLAPEGFIKSWRAVPFFRGIGYVKLVAGYMLSIYYPLYMGLALYYIIWILKEPFPFQECSAGVKITETGYSTYGKNGQQCLRETFLKSPFEDPYWYGIYAGLMLLIWIFIAILCVKKTRSYITSLTILFFPTLVSYIIVMIKSILKEEQLHNLNRIFQDVDWKSLTNANLWYYACIQMFFSTNVGFGSFITNAGIMYDKANPLWIALGYITVNILLGSGSIIMSQIMIGNVNTTINEGEVAELHLITLIYDMGQNSVKDEFKWLIILGYVIIILAGYINMATLMYTMLKAISTLSINTLSWWQINVIISFMGYLFGCAALLRNDFDIVHLLDHYIVGNLILITVIIEVFALIIFYGTERIRSDFEFMLGHILSNVWILLWWLLPLLLTIIFAWGMTTLPLEGIFKEDPAWLYGTGWAIVLTAFIFIFMIGIFIVIKQDGYTLNDKIKASLKPSNNWGPKDPMSRHTWIQWNSKVQHGEKDFTLKRKGTKDYTRSIKKNAKKAASDLSTSVPGVYLQNNGNDNTRNSNGSNNYIELYSLPVDLNSKIESNHNGNPVRAASLISSIDSDFSYNQNHPSNLANKNKMNNNPLAQAHLYEGIQNDPITDGYGETFRKGPYVIDDSNIDHVCFRKYSESEDATEL